MIMILPSSPSPIVDQARRAADRDPAGGEMPMKRCQPLFSLLPMSGEVVSNTDKHKAALSLDIRIHGGRSIGEVLVKSLRTRERPLCL